MAPTQSHPTWIWDKEPSPYSSSLSPQSAPLKASLEPPSEDSLLGGSNSSSSSSASDVVASGSSVGPDSSSTAPAVSAAPTPTIRFPPSQNGFCHRSSISDYVCRWEDCVAKFYSSSALIEHLQVKHVNTQTLGEVYVCLWTSCKVFSRKSCSRTWLERHVLSHGGNKPYRCIVDGCGHRFSSQNLLQRHVNNHFTDSGNGSYSSSSKGRLSGDGSGNAAAGIGNGKDAKMIRRNGKRLRYRRHPFSARTYDFFDAGIMEGVQHSLIEFTERTMSQVDSPLTGHSVTLHSKVLGKRLEPNGQSKVLLRWYPPDVLEDEWVDIEGWQKKKVVRISALPSHRKDHLYDILNSNLLSRAPRRFTHSRRKPPPPSSVES